MGRRVAYVSALVLAWMILDTIAVTAFRTSAAGFPVTVGVIWYAWHRRRTNRRELEAAEQEAAQAASVTPWPVTPLMPGVPSPAGEERVRQAIPKTIKQQVWVRDGGRCRHCGISDAEAMMRDAEHLHYDHIRPWSLNGADTVANIQLLCGPCNRTKSAKYTPI
jgi:hypothetical protein